MTLQEKHYEAVETKNYWDTKIGSLLSNIRQDLSGACWHVEQMESIILEKKEKLESLTYEQKLSMPLYGLSVGIKDLFCIKGLQTTAGSKILENFISPYDSTVWATLESKGVLLGAKLAMDEFAMGSFSHTSYLGKVSIPGHPDRSAGGSSGGSGAALKADLVDFTVGSDTGGSVRLPASFCSVVGYKPSYGAFSRYGMIAYASSLDQAGFLTKKLADLKYLLESGISVKDNKDMTVKGLSLQLLPTTGKIGYFSDLLEDESVALEVRSAYRTCLQELESAGYLLEPVVIDYMKQAAKIYYILACSEASSNLAKYQGIYYGKQLISENFTGSFWEQAAQYRAKYFGIEVQKRIILGSYILSSENFSSMYQKAEKLRQLLKIEFTKVFSKVDSLVLPVSPMVAPLWSDIDNMTTERIYLSDFMTVPFSLAGLPALSVPWYHDHQGLGIGMQWVGPYMSDMQLISRVMQIEQSLGK